MATEHKSLELHGLGLRQECDLQEVILPRHDTMMHKFIDIKCHYLPSRKRTNFICAFNNANSDLISQNATVKSNITKTCKSLQRIVVMISDILITNIRDALRAEHKCGSPLHHVIKDFARVFSTKALVLHFLIIVHLTLRYLPVVKLVPCRRLARRPTHDHR